MILIWSASFLLIYSIAPCLSEYSEQYPPDGAIGTDILPEIDQFRSSEPLSGSLTPNIPFRTRDLIYGDLLKKLSNYLMSDQYRTLGSPTEEDIALQDYAALRKRTPLWSPMGVSPLAYRKGSRRTKQRTGANTYLRYG